MGREYNHEGKYYRFFGVVVDDALFHVTKTPEQQLMTFPVVSFSKASIHIFIFSSSA